MDACLYLWCACTTRLAAVCDTVPCLRIASALKIGHVRIYSWNWTRAHLLVELDTCASTRGKYRTDLAVVCYWLVLAPRLTLGAPLPSKVSLPPWVPQLDQPKRPLVAIPGPRFRG
jgi:hypothetical protein